jgi:hypothetical protein
VSWKAHRERGPQRLFKHLPAFIERASLLLEAADLTRATADAGNSLDSNPFRLKLLIDTRHDVCDLTPYQFELFVLDRGAQPPSMTRIAHNRVLAVQVSELGFDLRQLIKEHLLLVLLAGKGFPESHLTDAVDEAVSCFEAASPSS